MQSILSPWTGAFDSFARSVQQRAILVAPFITEPPLRRFASLLYKKSHPQISLLTNLAADSMLRGSLDTGAIVAFARQFPRTVVRHLPGLHAKVYVADEHTAIITSGNLTGGSLSQNYEYGIRIHDPAVVRRIAGDLADYSELGAQVSLEELERLVEITDILKKNYNAVVTSARSQLKKDFETQLEATRESLRELRGKSGESTNAIFVRTLMYLLERGPLTTREIHPLIQNIHPDLCDDSADRVINGVHFGRKWKHRVRGAQVDLRRKGLLELVEGKWHLVGKE